MIPFSNTRCLAISTMRLEFLLHWVAAGCGQFNEICHKRPLRSRDDSLRFIPFLARLSLSSIRSRSVTVQFSASSAASACVAQSLISGSAFTYKD